MAKGQLDEAVACYKKAVELGSEAARPVLSNAEQTAAKFADFLDGRYKPTTNAQRLSLAEVCQAKKRNHAAARLYADAFAADPRLADDFKSGHRYNAACFALLAAAGQGEDAAGLDDAEKARLREQALGWLRADLTSGPSYSIAAASAMQKLMAHWRQDGDLASLRESEALAKLPKAERKEWQGSGETSRPS